MIKEAVGFGSTVDEAKEDAIIALGASAEQDVQFEILEIPKKKVLGIFGGSQAKVRVFIELPDEEKGTKAAKKKEGKKKQDKAAKAKPQQSEKSQKPSQTDCVNFVGEDELAPDSNAAKAVAYLKSILNGMGCENFTVKVAEKENGALISLDGEGLGVIIGRRGETLEALRVITSLSANKGGGYYRVNINIGDYCEKREQALITLAERISKQVLASGKNRSLEPMSPYERRIIHTAVQKIEGVESDSVGEGENRHVIIHLKGKKVEPDREFRRSHGRNRERRRSDVVSAPLSREPMKDSNIPLYGKIEK